MPYTGARSKFMGRPYYRKPETSRKSAYTAEREAQDQDDELMALTSIYDSEVFHVEHGSYQGHFCARIELPSPFYLKGAQNSDDKNQVIEFLPPIVLQFRLPLNYPSRQKPNFQLRCNWLNKQQLTCLCSSLDDLWHKNKFEVILYTWTEFLMKESLSALNIKDCLDLSWALTNLKPFNLPSTNPPADENYDGKASFAHSTAQQRRPYRRNDYSCRPRHVYSSGDRRAIPEYGNLALLIPSLIEFNQVQIERQFNSSFHYCNVCLEEKTGLMCTRFKECGHIYCKECIKSYFEVQIEEGKVTALTCPYDKCKTQAVPSQVRDLVSEQLFTKYDRLLLSTTLDSMTDIQYCPRTLCQCAVVIEPNCTMGTCPVCFFVFCIFCRMSYHGVEACKMKSEERRQLYERYTNGTEDDKRVLESRYGKLQLRHLVDTILSDSWVDENSKQCPHCRSNIEKIDGCNKMSCWKCNKYFCWTCMAKLPDVDPYKHYENPNEGCFNRLFTGAFAELEDDNELEGLDDENSDEDD